MSEQYTDEYWAQKVGKLSASRFSDAMARTKTGWGAMRERYMGELITERLTGTPYPSFESKEMRRGMEIEPEARNMYQLIVGMKVQQVGWIEHPEIAMSGCSPDGFVGDDGLVEIKVPASHTHIATLNGGAIDKSHIEQMMWQMACTKRQWCDFVSYDPRLPPEMQIAILRVVTSEKIIERMENDARAFLAELDEKIKQLRQRYSVRAAA